MLRATVGPSSTGTIAGSKHPDAVRPSLPKRTGPVPRGENQGPPETGRRWASHASSATRRVARPADNCTSTPNSPSWLSSAVPSRSRGSSGVGSGIMTTIVRGPSSEATGCSSPATGSRWAARGSTHPLLVISAVTARGAAPRQALFLRRSESPPDVHAKAVCGTRPFPANRLRSTGLQSPRRRRCRRTRAPSRPAHPRRPRRNAFSLRSSSHPRFNLPAAECRRVDSRRASRAASLRRRPPRDPPR